MIQIVHTPTAFGYLSICIAKNPKYDGYQRGFFSMVFTFFAEKTSGGAIKN